MRGYQWTKLQSLTFLYQHYVWNIEDKRISTPTCISVWPVMAQQTRQSSPAEAAGTDSNIGSWGSCTTRYMTLPAHTGQHITLRNVCSHALHYIRCSQSHTTLHNELTVTHGAHSHGRCSQSRTVLTVTHGAHSHAHYFVLFLKIM